MPRTGSISSPDALDDAIQEHVPPSLLGVCARCAVSVPQWDLRSFNGRTICPTCFSATIDVARQSIRAIQREYDEPERRCSNCRAMVDPSVGSAWCPLVELGAERAVMCEDFVPQALQRVRDTAPGLAAMNEDPAGLWDRVRSDVEMTLNSGHAAWLNGTAGVALRDDILHVAVPDERAHAWLQVRLGPAIGQALEMNGHPGLRVEFELSPKGRSELGVGSSEGARGGSFAVASLNGVAAVTSPAVDPGAAGDTNSDVRQTWAPAAAESNGHKPTASNFNPAYTFELFVVGSNNRLAHASALAVADFPGKKYNPLVLYGGVGVGKTHLLQAIGHRWVERGGAAIYATSETFTNELIAAIRDGNTPDFRRRYRDVDILLVDDIQFIAGKEATQEEFFHTFNALYDQGKQIVLSSDRPPAAIQILEERLRSRFAWGLLADIQPPDLETRIAILEAKARARRRDVADDILEFLATRITDNIRELEGALNRLLALADLNGVEPSLVLAAGLVGGDRVGDRIHSTDVLQAVASYYRIPPSALSGRQRDRAVSVPRHIAMYLLREEVKLSLPQIGDMLGGRDHSTVMYGCNRVGSEMKRRTRMRKDVEAIRGLLYSGRTA